MPSIGPITSGFAGVTGTASGTLGQLQSFSTDQTSYVNVVGTLGGLRGTGEAYLNGSVVGTLSGPQGQAYGNGNYATTSGVLSGPTGYAEAGMLEPQFALVTGILTPIGGYSVALAGMVGVVQGKLGQVHGTSGNSAINGGVSSGGETPATGEGGGSGGDNATGNGDWSGRAGGELRGLRGFASDHQLNYALLSVPSGVQLFSFGHADTLTDGDGNPVAGYGLHGTLPVPTLVATGGTAVSMTLPVPKLTASGTTTILGEVKRTIPFPTLRASGTTTIVGRTKAKLRVKISLVARSGSRAAAKLPVPTLKASGTTARLARSAGTIPALTLRASGTTGQVGSVAGVLSGLRTANSGVVVVTGPRLTLRASGTAAVALEYEAYSVTLVEGSDGALDRTATTHYTNFPFDRILRFGTKYYGVAADGLYELDGDDYDGSPIVATVQTAETDFGKKQPKRPVAAWMAGTLPDDLRVSCITDGTDVNGAQYRERIARGSAARRVVFGRGARGHWISYRLTNTSGKEFEIEQFDPEYDVLKREV